MAKVTKKKKTKTVPVMDGKKLKKEVKIPISDNREVQDGITSKGKVSNVVPVGYAGIGLQLGATINLGDFQSARIDVFIQRNVEDTNESIEAGLEEISDILHEELARQADLLSED